MWCDIYLSPRWNGEDYILLTEVKIYRSGNEAMLEVNPRDCLQGVKG